MSSFHNMKIKYPIWTDKTTAMQNKSPIGVCVSVVKLICFWLIFCLF